MSRLATRRAALPRHLVSQPDSRRQPASAGRETLARGCWPRDEPCTTEPLTFRHRKPWRSEPQPRPPTEPDSPSPLREEMKLASSGKNAFHRQVLRRRRDVRRLRHRRPIPRHPSRRRLVVTRLEVEDFVHLWLRAGCRLPTSAAQDDPRALPRAPAPVRRCEQAADSRRKQPTRCAIPRSHALVAAPKSRSRHPLSSLGSTAETGIVPVLCRKTQTSAS